MWRDKGNERSGKEGQGERILVKRGQEESQTAPGGSHPDVGLEPGKRKRVSVPHPENFG
jgi:hypothetical protein